MHPFDRPYRITPSRATTGDWDSGVYEYDGLPWESSPST